LIARPASASPERIALAVRTGSAAASTWKLTLQAPCSAYGGAHRSGSLIYHVDMQPVGVRHRLGPRAETGEVGGQDAGAMRACTRAV